MSKIFDILEQLEWKLDKQIAESTAVLERKCEDAPCCGCCE